MGRGKKTLFYCIMVVMTLAVIEGMAQAAYWIAYGEFNGGGPPLPTPPAAAQGGGTAEQWERGVIRISHPYYGYTRAEASHPLNQVPPPRREDGVALIALLGGSVGLGVTDAFRSALETWFRDTSKYCAPPRSAVLLI